MLCHSQSPELVEPWAPDESPEWFKRVRKIQLIDAPSTLKAGFTQLFGAQITLRPRIKMRTRVPVSTREAAAIFAGASSGILIAAVVIGLCSFIS